MSEIKVYEDGMDAISRMAYISYVFQEARRVADLISNDAELAIQLNEWPLQFRPVAYEGASMSRAIQDFVKEGKLISWFNFLAKHGLPYRSHYHVGLGWAMARMKRPYHDLLSRIEPSQLWRIFDGWGYHDGFFKRKKATFPDDFPDGLLFAYYQGVGRSIWYDSELDFEKLKNHIGKYDVAFLDSIWRGIGIAAIFVGGITEIELNNLISEAGQHQSYLKAGLLMVALVRADTDSLNDDLDLASKTWLNRPVSEAVDIARKARPTDSSGQNYLQAWSHELISQMENK